jgi:MerR family transcriptional regulator, light-induced transcriptional regulator
MYSIKAVSQATGLSIETLRAWERRYRIVEPSRDPNGRRSYNPEDVLRLRKLREATERGHPISKLARLSVDDLGKLLTEPELRGLKSAAVSSFSTQILKAAENYRPDQVDQLLAMAMALQPVSQFVTGVLSPLLGEVGERWHRGEFCIAQERLVSAAVRRQVANVLDTYSRIATGPIMVLSTPSGERHELGILMCALLAAARNVRCHYLGTDLPVDAIATYATRVGAHVVALSIVMSEDDAAIANDLARLAQFLPEHLELWVGGAAAGRLDASALPAGLRRIDSLDGFEQEVALLSARLSR